MVTLVRGRTEKIRVQFFMDKDNAIPAPITAATIKCLLKPDVRKADADTETITKGVGTGIEITDGANGICEVTIAATDTNTLQYNKMYMECVAKLVTGEYLGDGFEEVEIKGNVVKTLF